jgi:hypothetical protein
MFSDFSLTCATPKPLPMQAETRKTEQSVNQNPNSSSSQQFVTQESQNSVMSLKMFAKFITLFINCPLIAIKKCY